MTTEEIGPNIEISWAKTKKVLLAMKKFCESSEQLFPANLQGQCYKCQEVRLYILKELKALDSGKNMDKNKSGRSNHVLFVLILNAMFYAGIGE